MTTVPDISGQVQIKRKVFWVVRYAEIINGSLYYYHNQGDTLPRGVFQLAGSTVIEQIISQYEFLIQFTSNPTQSSQRIIFKFESQQEQRKWLRHLQQPSSKAFSAIHEQQQYKQQQFPFRNSLEHSNNSIATSTNLVNTPEFAVLIQQQQHHQQQQHVIHHTNAQENSHRNIGGSNKSSFQNQKQNPQDLLDASLIRLKQGSTEAQKLINQFQLQKEALNTSKSVLIDVQDSLRFFVPSSNMVTVVSYLSGAKLLQKILEDSRRFIQQIQNSSHFQVISSSLIILCVVLISQLTSALNLTFPSFVLLALLVFIPLPSLSIHLYRQFFSHNVRMPLPSVNQINCLVTGVLPLQLNEFIRTLSKEYSQRTKYQAGLTQCFCFPDKKNEFKLIYASGKHEEFTQNVFFDTTNIYLIESSISYVTNATLLHRVFEIPAQSVYRSHFLVNYYLTEDSSIPQSIVDSPRYLLQTITAFIQMNQAVTMGSLISSNTITSLLGNLNNQQQQEDQSIDQDIIVQNGMNKKEDAEEVQLQQQQIASNSLELSQKSQLTQLNEIVVEQPSETVLLAPSPSQQIDIIDPSTVPSTHDTRPAETIPEIPADKLPFLLQGDLGNKYNNVLVKCFQAMQKCAPLSESNNWIVNKSKGDFKSHTRVEETSSIVMSRGEVTVNRSMAQIIKYLQDKSLRKSWDDMFKESKVIEVLSETTTIEHSMFNGLLMVSGRDMCLIQANFEVQGSFYFIGTSITHQAVPENKTFVRANLKVGGWVVMPVAGQANQCVCVYLTCCDPCGKISEKIKEYGAKLQTENALRFKKAIEKTM